MFQSIHDLSDEELEKLGLQRLPDKPKAAPCSGAQFYMWDGESPHMEVALTHRTKLVGTGYGISGGGFAEFGAFLGTDVGTMRRISIEAYRELEEELDAKTIHAALPQEVFERYAQPLDGFLVRVNDKHGNKVHAPVYYAFPLTMAERLALANLPETPERTGQLQWLTLRWRPSMTQNSLAADVTLWHSNKQLSWSGFFWQHEVRCVFQKLALLASQGRLWNDRERRA